MSGANTKSEMGNAKPQPPAQPLLYQAEVKQVKHTADGTITTVFTIDKSEHGKYTRPKQLVGGGIKTDTDLLPETTIEARRPGHFTKPAQKCIARAWWSFCFRNNKKALAKHVMGSVHAERQAASAAADLFGFHDDIPMALPVPGYNGYGSLLQPHRVPVPGHFNEFNGNGPVSHPPPVYRGLGSAPAPAPAQTGTGTHFATMGTGNMETHKASNSAPSHRVYGWGLNLLTCCPNMHTNAHCNGEHVVRKGYGKWSIQDLAKPMLCPACRKAETRRRKRDFDALL